MNLEFLGATPELRASSSRPSDLARVTVSHRDQYRLIAEAGELDAEPSGALWYNAATRAAMPVVGDWVAARVISADQAIVEAVLPRRTLFARRAPDGVKISSPSRPISTWSFWSADWTAISICAAWNAT